MFKEWNLNAFQNSWTVHLEGQEAFIGRPKLRWKIQSIERD
jgi:hypothetical protein